MAEEGGKSIMQELAFLWTAVLLSFIIALFFILRGLDKYNGWRDGNKDELWIFLSLWLGAAGALLIGIPWLLIIVAESDGAISFLSFAFPLGICLEITAIVLSTIYYFLKWRTKK